MPVSVNRITPGPHRGEGRYSSTVAEERPIGIAEILAVARRRWMWIAVPLLLGPIVGYLVALKLTPVFTSQAFVLVEQQKVPDTFVPSMVTDQLETRLMTMQDQILSNSRLQLLIEQYGLFKKEVGKVPIQELVTRLKSSIKVTTLHPDSLNTLRGFYVSVDADTAASAQQICGRVLSMFMDENLSIRSKRAQETTDFLVTQLQDAKQKLDENDGKLAEFKTRYMGRLPTDEQSNLQMLATLSARLDAANEAVAQAQQQRVMQSSLLARQTPVRGAAGPQVKISDVEKQLMERREQLASMQTRYTPDHPDVVALKEQVATLEAQLQSARAMAPAESPTADLPAADDPEAAQLQASIRAIDERIKNKRAEQARLEQQIGTIQARIQLSPMLEGQFKQLTRDYDTALQFYNDLLAKKTQSEMVRNLEQRREGEQFRVMDAPSLPSRPSWPDRHKITLAGLGAGFAFGVLLASILEYRERFLRTERDVQSFIGLPVLVVIQDLSSK